MAVAALIAPLVLTRPAAADDTATDHVAQVEALFAVVACGTDAVPDGFDARVVTRHCARMKRRYASYRRGWARRAGEYIARLRPAGVPHTVVYPFGGGDLATALVVFPDATEITTISLEAAGDIRTIDHADRAQLDAELAPVVTAVTRLFRAAHSTTQSLQTASHSRLPGTIVFALAALAAHGYEPRGLRYFVLEPDGAPRYLDDAELDRLAAERDGAPSARRPRAPHFWREQESPFANVEITYARPGEAALHVYRHICANLDDSHLQGDPRLLQHLAAKGPVAAMTKAASFLLWFDDFSLIRRYLVDHIAWMISDASGIPPDAAIAGGLAQDTYGEFTGPYFVQDQHDTRGKFVKLWSRQPHRVLPFRFGYPDRDKHNHLLVTHPRAR